MESSTSIIPINQEIKFKKADLEAMKSTGLDSPKYLVCSISHVQYFFSTYLYDDGNISIYLYVSDGNAATIDLEAKYSVKSVNFSKDIKWEHKKSKDAVSSNRVVADYFDIKNGIFVNEEVVVTIKGFFKIGLKQDANFYPISAEWKIKEVDLKAVVSKNYGSLKSKRFSISSDSDIKFGLQIYPNSEKDGQTWIHFYGPFSLAQKVKKNLNFSIDSNFYKNSTFWNTHLCPTEDLFNPDKQYFKNGEMTLKINGTVFIDKESIQPTVLACKNGIATKRFMKHRGKDFTIAAEGKNVKVHKKVLIESSPVFAGMFESKMKEVEEKKMTVTDFGYDIVDTAVKLLYSSSVPPKFNFEQMLSLLKFSDKYDIQIITNLVENYLIERISVTNVCALINFTTTDVNAPKLYQKCKEFLMKCMSEKKSVHGLDTLDQKLINELLMNAFVQPLETDKS